MQMNSLLFKNFLPRCYSGTEVHWQQEEFGHPANWGQDTAEFCLKVFVSVALRIQDAQGIPGAIEFDYIYEHKITALVDNVEIVQERAKELFGPKEKVVVYTLKKGESIQGKITKQGSPIAAALIGQEYKPILSFRRYKEPVIFGEIEADKVRVTCVPKDNELIHKYFPNLPELEYE